MKEKCIGRCTIENSLNRYLELMDQKGDQGGRLVRLFGAEGYLQWKAKTEEHGEILFDYISQNKCANCPNV